MNLIKLFTVCIFTLFCFAGCSKKVEELKSPCVASSNIGSNTNPCDTRVNPNFGWMGRVV